MSLYRLALSSLTGTCAQLDSNVADIHSRRFPLRPSPGRSKGGARGSAAIRWSESRTGIPPQIGAPSWTRTSDHQLRRLMLYPPELWAPGSTLTSPGPGLKGVRALGRRRRPFRGRLSFEDSRGNPVLRPWRGGAWRRRSGPSSNRPRSGCCARSRRRGCGWRRFPS